MRAEIRSSSRTELAISRAEIIESSVARLLELAARSSEVTSPAAPSRVTEPRSEASCSSVGVVKAGGSVVSSSSSLLLLLRPLLLGQQLQQRLTRVHTAV